jgi:hypothetical protein
VDAYGAPKDAKDFAMKAQLVNYDQYRALMEGFSSHMWDWYTGVIIWKTQNPWTALRGQMYDYYLDVNACLYGLRKGSEALHIMMNPADSMVVLLNNGFDARRNLMAEVRTYDMLTGKDSLFSSMFNEIGASMSKKLFSVSGFLRKLDKREGVFVSLKLLTEEKEVVSDNLYWLPGVDGTYAALQQMKEAPLKIEARRVGEKQIKVTMTNAAGNPVSFFNRIAVINTETNERVLPAFFSDNYISILPGGSKTVIVEVGEKDEGVRKRIQVYGWNLREQVVDINE